MPLFSNAQPFPLFSKVPCRTIFRGIALAFLLSPTAFAAQDSTTKFHLNPEFEKPYGYSIGVEAGDYLYLGGVTAVDEQGNEVYAGDPRKQMELIYKRIGKILSAHGADFGDVVSETIYYNIDNEEYFKALEARTAAYNGIDGPSAAGIRIAGFSSDKINIEITAVVYVGD